MSHANRSISTGLWGYAARLRRSFSTTGLLFATLFFAASLTPSLMPRTVLTQGALSGFSAAAGYAFGTFLRWLWTYLELREPSARTSRTIKLIAAVVCLAVAVAFLWKASEWQNSVRELMGMERVETADPLMLGLVAAAIFAALVVLARLFNIVFGVLSRWLQRYVPRRVSNVIGGLIAVALFWSVAEGVFFRMALRTIDNSLRQLDALIDDDIAGPAGPMKTGSSASLVDWHDLGRQGRRYVVTGPTAADIGNFFQGEALEPIRVYVGLNSAETAEERAKLALEEMKRVGAFDRSILVVVVPTGTGWVDPAAMDPLEYLHKGDVASVAMQYSYLLSWLSLLFEPGYGAEAGNALFKEVYGYWTTLPRDDRPKLYLHGLSLGSMNSEISADLFNVIGDPFQGALWSGPPFPSRTWNMVTANRNPGSPEWLPRFRDGSIIRFTNQSNALDIPGAQWGPIRIVYLQYASDPVTFFNPKAFYREPDWMKAPRGPDVSPALRWYPGITMLQLAFDMAVGTTSPIGYGHVYAPQHYIDGWMAVTDPAGVTTDDVGRLKELFKDRY
ncbi:alpha/beta hydrolase [Ferirhizobium litorale]|uniref:Alpha/beta-hydrolase family protein n=1 Tax=Ferirhizobium litorale TaxID=2927786 RepID=A0AAE3U229_9HYPH|nr:alpha/beta-hydrolase family protein [Fererhizobium litorale]MDI7920549.1 alpha/beta-hydrolase family protein [Fererhizobium litorale]